MSLITSRIAYSLDDVCIVPAGTSYIESRKNCIPFYENFTYTNGELSEIHKTLPIFTAPMTSVIGENNINAFLENNITPVIPRSVPFSQRVSYVTKQKYFVAFSLKEAEWFVSNFEVLRNPSIPYKICIDVANGNMDPLLKIITTLKELYHTDMIIMSGNVAHSDSYRNLSYYGCNYVRVSVGSGSACTTATNTGIYMPMASLIDDCKSHGCQAKIVADGGLNSYRNIIKALALGADFVMLGGMLNKLTDSAGEVVTSQTGKKYKIHFGMASTRGQIALGKENSLTPPEGKVVYSEMSKNSIADFSKEFSHYLRSAMSYCGKGMLDEFVGNVELYIMSPNAAKQYNQSREDDMPTDIGNAQIIL